MHAKLAVAILFASPLLPESFQRTRRRAPLQQMKCPAKERYLKAKQIGNKQKKTAAQEETKARSYDCSATTMAPRDASLQGFDLLLQALDHSMA